MLVHGLAQGGMVDRSWFGEQIGVDTAGGDNGWGGRPRPKFAELLRSSPRSGRGDPAECEASAGDFDMMCAGEGSECCSSADETMDSDDGWGRPRPKFEDLLPSSPQHSDDDDDRPSGEGGTGDGDTTMDSASEYPKALQQSPKQFAAGVEIEGKSVRGRVALLIDFPPPGCDGVPRAELNLLYQKSRPGIPSLAKYYTAWSNGEKSHAKFTCVFTCPSTGERFESGVYGGDVTVRDSTCWYGTKKDAMNAAAARALDCFSLRRCQGTEKQPYQRCADDPYLFSEEAPMFPSLPEGVVLPTVRREEDGASNAPAALPPVKKALQDWYAFTYKRMFSEGLGAPFDVGSKLKSECYRFWSNLQQAPNHRFVAVFTCPITGERFASGKLAGEERPYDEDYWFYDSTENTLAPGARKESDVGENQSGVDGFNNLHKIPLVWYRTKKEAERAAAGRALDCFTYRESPGDNISSTRYCKEIPYNKDDIPEAWKAVCESVQRVDDYDSSSEKTEVQVRWGSALYESRHVSNLIYFTESQDQWRARYKERRQAMQNDHMDESLTLVPMKL